MQKKQLIFPVLLLVLTGCSSIVQVMPTPVVLEDSKFDISKLDKDTVEKKDIWVAYATNKLPSGSKDTRSYAVFFDQDIRLGFAKYKMKQHKDRERTYDMSLDQIEEVAIVQKESALDATSTPLDTYFDIINKALAKSLDKDLTVYIHGANAPFYRAVAQAAQYRHFTGQNSVVLVYVWPTSENVLKYSTDVKNASKSVTTFERLLELLFRRTDARSLNIIAYSAGSQIANPALATIARKEAFVNPDGKRKAVRFSEIYYASPDLDVDAFMARAPVYMQRARNVTFTINLKDFILATSSDSHGKSRLGRPSEEELSEKDFDWLKRMSATPALTIIDVSYSKIPNMSTHSYWYDNSWVSSDVLLQLLFHAPPGKRGLKKDIDERGITGWYFPEDYPQRVGKAATVLLENYHEE